MATSTRTTRFILAAFAVAAIGAAHAGQEAASGDFGLWFGETVNVSPFVDIFWFHDDNPNNARNQKSELLEEHNVKLKSSEGYSVRPGLNLEIPGNCWKLAGRTYYALERYSDNDVDDRDDWGESLVFSGETDAGLMWRLDESVTQVDMEEMYVDDFPYNYSTRDRLEMIFGGSLSKRITDRSRLEVGGHYSKTDYDAKNMFDYIRYGGRVSYAHRLTEQTDWTLTVDHSLYKQDSNDEGTESGGKNKSTKLLAGIRTRSTERLTFDAQAGAEFFDSERDENGNDSDKTTFTYSLGANWQASERLTIALHGLGEHEPAEDIGKNSVEAQSIGILASYRPFERWLFSAGATYRHESYVRRVSKITDTNDNPYSVNDNGDDRDDDIIDLYGRIVFRINNYASIFGACTYHDVSSSIHDFGYERTRYSAGASLRY